MISRPPFYEPSSRLLDRACTLKPILAATPARSISLPRPATVNGAPLSETKVKPALVPAAPAIHVPEQLESYTVSSSAAN